MHMATQIEIRRDTAANWAAINPVLLSGEPSLDTTTGDLRVGDGVTLWSDLPVILNAGRVLAADANATSPLRVQQDARQSATYGSSPVVEPVYAALSQTLKALSTHDDSGTVPFRVIGLGSSVGLGATLPDPATQTPLSRLYALLAPKLNPLGNNILSKTNGSVNGSTITGGQQADYTAAKTAAGGAPTLGVLAYGMNDGMPEQYHRGQTFPGVYSNGKTLIRAMQSDGADVIIFTTPHPRTDIMPDASWAISGASQYPSATPIPATTAAASIVNITLDSGAVVPASYRHLRVNQALRRLAADTGSVLIDVERYWFQAVAAQTLNNLFNTGEYAHPNLLGHQLSYWLAIDDFMRSFKQATVAAAPAPAGFQPVATLKPNNAAYTSTTALTSDSQLAFTVGPNQVWTVFAGVFFTGSAGDLRVGLSLPAGAAGSAAIQGPSLDALGNASHPMTSRRVGLPDTYGLPVGGTDADAYAEFRAIVRLGATGGTINAQFCQNTSSASATIIYQDSYMIATRIS
jgi:lysophospholipase L1-like esterase